MRTGMNQAIYEAPSVSPNPQTPRPGGYTQTIGDTPYSKEKNIEKRKRKISAFPSRHQSDIEVPVGNPRRGLVYQKGGEITKSTMFDKGLQGLHMPSLYITAVPQQTLITSRFILPGRLGVTVRSAEPVMMGTKTM